ncbi:hypothetical protein HanIR_Chr16g0817381 [Helianthus annuus]|nr:hypothetical protein HanIR_Chr16g0817381 [Helianthus annuus]
MKTNTFPMVFNAVSLVLFFVLVSMLIRVDGSRPMREHCHPSPLISELSQLYSGPSRRGPGH